MPPAEAAPAHHYLFPQNRKAWAIALACVRRMDVVPFVGVVGFNADRMDRAFELYGVTDEERFDVEEKVALLEDFFLQRFQRDASSSSRGGGGKGDEQWLLNT